MRESTKKENNEKNLEKRKNQQIEYREKLQEVRFWDISKEPKNCIIQFLRGGPTGGPDFIPIVLNTFLEQCREYVNLHAAQVFMLFTSCSSLCLIDVNPKAVKICKET